MCSSCCTACQDVKSIQVLPEAGKQHAHHVALLDNTFSNTPKLSSKFKPSAKQAI